MKAERYKARRSIPVFLSTFLLKVRSNITMPEAPIVVNVVRPANPAEIVCGKRNNPAPIDTVASTMQLPIMSPIATSYCLLRIAVKSTTSSGSDVPIEAKKNPKISSGIPKISDNEIIACITIYDPIATPMNPTIAVAA